MTRRILIIILLTISTIAMAAGKDRKFVLVIDAGHGGHDAGAVGSFSKEKNINLAAALAFGRYVEKNCPDVNVIYTRKTDVFVTLHDRADIANKNHADVFISIHTNSLPAGRIARGLETYTMGMRRSNEKLSAAQRENSVITIEKDYKEKYAGYDPNSPESAIMFEFINDKNMAKSVELAKLVQRNVCSIAGRPDKGVKQDVFLVLRETSMPACLIELGFISTPDEERMLNDASAIDTMARGIYEAFIKYKNGNKSMGAPSVSVKNEVPALTSAKPELNASKKEQKKKEIEKVQTRVPVAIPDEKPVEVKPEIKKGKEKAQTEVTEKKVSKATPTLAFTEPKVEEAKKVSEKAIKKEQEKLVSKPVEKETKAEMPKKAEATKKAESPKVVEAPKKAEALKVIEAPKVVETPKKAEAKTTSADISTPVFKVQIMVSDKPLKDSDPRLKGKTAEFYKDGNMYKYTIGSTSDYSEISALRKELAETFPGCFVVAFKNGEKMILSEAINEAKKNKKK